MLPDDAQVEPEAYEVQFRIRAASLNFRDRSIVYAHEIVGKDRDGSINSGFARHPLEASSLRAPVSAEYSILKRQSQ